MLVSVPGLAAIQRHEGLRLDAYQDSAGVWTIGYGSTEYADGTPVRQGDMLQSNAAADALFRETLREYESAVSRSVLVPLSQLQFDALVSLAYNIGTQAFRESTLLKRLNTHDYAGAANEFLRWNKAGGQVLEGLRRRREAERAMFLSGTDTRPNDAMAGFDLPNLHTHSTLSPADNSAKLPIKPMAPVIAALLPSLVSLIPELGKLFSSGSDVSERNVAATRVVAERVAEIVTNATAAPNLQGAVETMQADPAALDAARAAVRREYFELQERTTADARKFVSEYGTTHNVRTVVGRFTFPELLSLVFIGLASLGVGYLMHTRQLSGELLGGVVTLMLIGGWTEIRKFWFGLGAPEGDQKRGS